MENQNEKINAYCDICDRDQIGTEEVLTGCGWYLGNHEQFCPNCNQ